MSPITMTTRQTHHQHRLKTIVKRLVIELGYLEHCLSESRQDTHLETAAISIDTAIDSLTEHLTP